MLQLGIVEIQAASQRCSDTFISCFIRHDQADFESGRALRVTVLYLSVRMFLYAKRNMVLPVWSARCYLEIAQYTAS